VLIHVPKVAPVLIHVPRHEDARACIYKHFISFNYEDNIKMDLREQGSMERTGFLDSAGSGWVQWRVFVNTVMNLRVP
jgi:hypothetical protein